MFFRKKKEKNEIIEPIKYYVNIDHNETNIYYTIYYCDGMKNTKFVELCYEIMDYLMDNYYVFSKRIFMKSEEINSYMKVIKNNPNTEYLFDGKDTIIEKQKGPHSLLIKDCFFNRDDGESVYPTKDYFIYAFAKDVSIKDNDTIENKYDIYAEYEDHYNEFQSLSFIIENNLYSVEELISLSIKVCKKYKKNLELKYKDVTEEK